MATQQHKMSQWLGLFAFGGGAAATFALSGTPASGGFSPTWMAWTLNPSESKTLSAVKVFASAVGGTLAGTDLVCDIYSDTAGTGPNASLASSSTVTATPTGAAWVEFTGFSLALTAGTQYWIVLRNANATPATNFPTYRWVSPYVLPSLSDAFGIWASGSVKTSTNSGSTWSLNANMAGGWRVQYSDGTYDGLPFSGITTTTNANSVFGTQAVGMQVVVPPNAVLNIRGASLCISKTSTPGAAFFNLYNGTTLIGTSASIPQANISGPRHFGAYFPSTIPVQPGTTLNLVLCDTTTADPNTKNYLPQFHAVDNDANSFALMPFEGTARKVVTTDYTAGTPSFATDQTTVIPFGLLLDSTGEFLPAAFGQTTGARSVGTY